MQCMRAVGQALHWMLRMSPCLLLLACLLLRRALLQAGEEGTVCPVSSEVVIDERIALLHQRSRSLGVGGRDPTLKNRMRRHDGTSTRKLCDTFKGQSVQPGQHALHTAQEHAAGGQHGTAQQFLLASTDQHTGMLSREQHA